LIVLPITWSSSKLAMIMFSHSSLLRLLVGMGGAILALMIGYVSFFGFKIPGEIQRLFLAAERRICNYKKNREKK